MKTKRMVIWTFLAVQVLAAGGAHAADVSKTFTALSEVSYGIYYGGKYLKIKGTVSDGTTSAVMIKNYSDDDSSFDDGLVACYKQAMIAQSLGDKGLKVYLNSGQSEVTFGTLSESGVTDGKTMTVSSTATSNSSTVIYCTVTAD